jgi:hypothetical protein
LALLLSCVHLSSPTAKYSYNGIQHITFHLSSHF